MSTQITTGKVRFSYLNVFEPRAMAGGSDLKYSVTLLVPKSDKKTLQKIKAAIAEAKEVYLTKNSGKKLPPDLKTTLHDGDGTRPSDGEPYGPEAAGCYVITVSSKNQPVLVDRDRNEILDQRDLYSGCYGRAVINFYVYDNINGKGVSAGLNGVMKLSDGEPLAGAVVTDADWDDGWDDDDEDSDGLDDLLG